MLIALAGKPSVGKSAFFKAATLAEVEIAAYPFTTIKSHEGVAFVKIKCAESDFHLRCKPKHGYCINGSRFVPVKLMDIPGLIEGSYKGHGRGNEFLDDIRQADALIHIIDISGSTNEKGEIVEPGSYDPLKDVIFIENEIDMWLYGLLKKVWVTFSKQVKQEKSDIIKSIAKQFSGLRVDEDVAEKVVKGMGKSLENWNDNDLMKLASDIRKLTKPLVIAANKIDIEASEKNIKRLNEKFPEQIIIPCSAEAEIALKEAAKKGLIEYIPGENKFKIIDQNKLSAKQINGLNIIKEKILNKYGSTGVQNVLDKTVLELLRYNAVYPVENENRWCNVDGQVLPDVHLMKEGSSALDLAYKVHTDIGNKFVGAIDCRTKKKLGKEYKLKNMDVIKILT